MNILQPMERTRRRGGGGERRNPNGIVTVLLKEFSPGLFNFNGRTKPPRTWKHYAAAPDTHDQDEVEYNNCLDQDSERVSLESLVGRWRAERVRSKRTHKNRQGFRVVRTSRA
jgi:hypothetical protein